MEAKWTPDLPPGFRFHPTDEELIIHYLKNQALSRPCPVPIILEIDIYKFDPWQLPDNAGFGENEWYFFSPRDRKYPNGVRPNRATVSGYWKATGTDKAIYSRGKYVGIKKALVFYKGRPPKGIKTDWIMHEYRLVDSRVQPVKPRGSMRLDDWVLCRIYKKRHATRTFEEKEEDSPQSQITMAGPSDVIDQQQKQRQQQMFEFPRTYSLSYLLDLDTQGPFSQLINDNNSTFDYQSILGHNPGLDQNIGLSQHMYGNPVYKYP